MAKDKDNGGPKDPRSLKKDKTVSKDERMEADLASMEELVKGIGIEKGASILAKTREFLSR